MKAFKKTLIAAAVAVGVFAPAAQAGVQFGLNTANIPGTTTAFSFLATEMTITSFSSANIAVTDLDGNGVIDGSFGDSYAEIGDVSVVNFKNGIPNVPPGISGLGLGYELYATYTLAGPVGLVGPNIVAPIFAGSAIIWYDEDIDGAPDGTMTNIGTLALPPGGGDCNITAGSSFTEGSCKIVFDFNPLAGGGTGIWTVAGVNLATIDSSMIIDININNLGPAAATANLPNINQGGVTNFTADHDGSAVLLVPEPGALALLGVALFGIGVARRRRA